MIYLNKFDSHASYESELNGGGVDISLPNVSYCKDVNDVHYNPYNLIEFYVGEITGTTPQTVKIYTGETTFDEVTVSEGNKWYSYLLPKDKGLCRIESGAYDSNSQTWSNRIVTKAVIKADISFNGDINYPYKNIIPPSTVEASFKGSNTSNVTDMSFMFCYCSGLTSLDVSNFDTSKVTDMTSMFNTCNGLTSLDVSSFDTSNVTDMKWMFDYCSGFTTLNVSSFDTSNVTSMYQMFEGCTNLRSLDLSGWDMSNVASTTEMFKDCSKLSTITMKGCSEDTRTKIKSVMPSSATIVP